MGYDYKTSKLDLLTPDGIKLLAQVRDHAFKLLEKSGAFMMCRAWEGIKLGAYDSWTAIAAVEWMVENGDLVEVTDKARVTAQNRVFVRSGP